MWSDITWLSTGCERAVCGRPSSSGRGTCHVVTCRWRATPCPAKYFASASASALLTTCGNTAETKSALGVTTVDVHRAKQPAGTMCATQ